MAGAVPLTRNHDPRQPVRKPSHVPDGYSTVRAREVAVVHEV